MTTPGVFKNKDQGSCGDSPSKQAVKICQACADESFAVDSWSCAQTCIRFSIGALASGAILALR